MIPELEKYRAAKAEYEAATEYTMILVDGQICPIKMEMLRGKRSEFVAAEAALVARIVAIAEESNFPKGSMELIEKIRDIQKHPIIRLFLGDIAADLFGDVPEKM